MQPLTLLVLHQFFVAASGLFYPNVSLVKANLYECERNQSFGIRTVLLSNPVFQPCNASCCQRNRSNATSDSDVCQVTVLSASGMCTSRLCYPGGCATLTSITSYAMRMNTSAILSQIRSSISSWPTLTNVTGVKWVLWKNPNYSAIRSSALVVLLIANMFLTLLTLFVLIRSLRHARILAERKSRRYSLF